MLSFGGHLYRVLCSHIQNLPQYEMGQTTNSIYLLCSMARLYNPDVQHLWFDTHYMNLEVTAS